MRLRVLIIAFLAMALWCSQAQAQSISVDHVDGLSAPDAVQMETPITFHIRMTNDVGNSQKGITNGFRVYSPTGAEWTTTVADSTDAIGGTEFDLVYVINNFSVTGSGADTVGVGGAVIFNPVGMPAGFDDITHTITIGPIDPAYQGGEICLDSSFFPPSGLWKWAGPPEAIPSWDGPHCFTIGEAGPEPPVITCPDPTSEELCDPGPVCLDIPIAGEGVTVTVAGDAVWDAGQFCFDADTSGAYGFRIIAANSGGADTCDFSVDVAINRAPAVVLDDDDTFTTCGIEEICYSYVVSDPDAGDPVIERLISGTGTLDTLNNSICFLTEEAGDYTFIVEVEDACGATDQDTIVVTVIINEVSTLDCPTEPVEIALCEAGQVCIPLAGTNITEFESNMGAWADNEFCFPADTAGTYTVDITASGPCNEIECSFSVVVTFADGPRIACPENTIPASVCGPGEQICLDLPITGADEVATSLGDWADGQLCFVADAAGVIAIEVIATGCGGADTCEVNVDVHFNQAPSITTAGVDTTTSCEPGSYCFTYSVDDPDGDPVTEQLVVSPSGATIDTVANEVCFNFTENGDYLFVVQASDDCAVSADTMIVTVGIQPAFSIDCPSTQIPISLCSAGEVCYPLAIQGADEVSASYGAWDDGQLCFTADTAGAYSISVSAAGPCGEGACELMFNVTFGDEPEIACPIEPIVVDQVPGQDHCVELPITGADTVYVQHAHEGWTAGWFEGDLCFDISMPGVYPASIIATSDCGADTCDVIIEVIGCPMPAIACPDGAIDYPVCEPGQVCIGLEITDAETVTIEGATWDDGQLCFEAEGFGIHEFMVIAGSPCGADTCELAVDVTEIPAPGIDCPAEPIVVTTQDEPYCMPMAITDYDSVVIMPDKSIWLPEWANDTLCFDASTVGTYWASVIAYNDCGETYCNIEVEVIDCATPTIDCPAEQPLFIPADELWCIPLVINGASSVEVVHDAGDSDILWQDNELCLNLSTPPDGLDTCQVILNASNSCGQTACTLVVIAEIPIGCQDAEIDCPDDTLEITLCDPSEPCELCFYLPITNAVNVTVDPETGYWHDDSLCFVTEGAGYYTFTVTAHAELGCDDAICEITILVEDYVWSCSEMYLSDTALYFSMAYDDLVNPDPQTFQVTTPDDDFCFDLAQASGFSWLSVPDSGCTWEDITLTVNGFDLLPGLYSAQVAVIGDPNEVCDPSSRYVTVYLEVLPQQSEDDVLRIPTVPGVPGARIEVPVSIEFVCNLYGVSSTFEFISDHFTFDSATFDGSLIEDWYNLTVTSDGNHIMIEADDDDGMIEPAVGNLVTLHFTVHHSAPQNFYPIDAMDAVFEMACWPPTVEPFEPRIIPGGVVVGTPDNYVCGYVVDPQMNPIEGATVELWAEYPTGTFDDRVWSDATGLFEFFHSTVVPFDLYAYKDGYYPAVIENLNYSQTGIMIVLTPIEDDITPTDMWVNFYCEFNTLGGEPFPVGTVIDAYDPDGVHCGSFTVRELGAYGFMPVYRDDPWTALDEGAEEGDVIRIYVNGIEAYPHAVPRWTGNGDAHEICLDVDGTDTHICELSTGWNLVSWPLDTDVDDIETVLASLGDAVDVVLGFEQGGLTWDPDFPVFSNLTEVDHLSGYWIKLNAPATLEITGSRVAATTPIMLNNGWNLVSYLPDLSMPPQTALASIDGPLDVALGFDEGYLVYDPDDEVHSNLDLMSQCYGYWLRVDGPAQLLYPGDGPVVAPQLRPDNILAAKTADDVLVTRSWMNLFSAELTLDGQTVPAGTRVTAHTADGQAIGSFTVAQDGLFGFMPVYGSDESPDGRRAVDPGHEFYLEIGGVEVNETFTWTTNGDRVEIGALTSKAHGSTDVLPEAYNLGQNYPNPFNPTTNIGFSLPSAMKARVEIYNVLGRLVAVPFDGMATSGYNEIVWNGRSDNGSEVASGVYFYRLTTGEYTETRKMTLLK